MSPPMISKAAARYTGAGGKEHCSLCRHFSPRRGGRCARVLGDISPMGWCKLFSREMRGLVADASSFNGGGGGPSLGLDFMVPGVMDPRITFTRASTGTYFDSAGVMQSAAINAPRWDYDPVTLALRGLLIEEARTNIWLQSADMANAATAKTGLVVAAPTVTANQTTAPDGTLTAARVVYPAVTGAGALSAINQNTTSVASAYAFSVYLRGNVGGEQVYLNNNSSGVYNTSPRFTLTTQWQRYVLVTPSLTAGFNHYFAIGVDLRNTGVQTATTAQTIFVWGAQLELGAFATSYIPTTSAAVTRSVESMGVVLGALFIPQIGTQFIEALQPVTRSKACTIVTVGTGGTVTGINVQGGNSIAIFDNTSGLNLAVAAEPIGTPYKVAFGYRNGLQRATLNGGAIVSATNATLSSPAGPTLWSGSNGLSSTMSGYVRKVSYWNRMLTDAELQALTA